MMRPVEILLVEDNPMEVRLAEEALKDTKLKLNLSIRSHGFTITHIHKYPKAITSGQQGIL